MATLLLPKTASEFIRSYGPEHCDLVELDVPVERVDFFYTNIPDDYADASNAEITFARPLRQDELDILPPHYVTDAFGTSLWRKALRGNIHPDNDTQWTVIDIQLAEGEDPVITVPVKRPSYIGRDNVRVMTHDRINVDTHLQRRLDNDDLNWELDTRRVGFKVSEWVLDWKVAPITDRYAVPRAFDHKSQKLCRRTTGLINALYPKRLEPVKTSQQSKTGRDLDLGADLNSRVELDASLFTRVHGKIGLTEDNGRVFTIGLRDNCAGYCAFRTPDYLAAPQFEHRSNDPCGLPVARVMVSRTPNAFHLTYLLICFTESNTSRRATKKVPMFYAIPVVVECAQVHTDPVNLRGLPPFINDEIARAPGLGNALVRGLNALQGELLKLKKACFDIDAVDGLSMEVKPAHHKLLAMAAASGTAPFEYASVYVDTLTMMCSALYGHTQAGNWGNDMLVAKPEPKKLQPVATPRRMLEL